jgi:hypothetical protein
MQRHDSDSSGSGGVPAPLGKGGIPDPFLRLLRAILVFGLALRLYHYLRNPSMWHDEAALVLNVLRKSFGDLLGPLFFSEASPPLFLWLEKAVVELLGDSTYALRLVPFLAGCISLVGMSVVARRLLCPAAGVWVTLLFACSDRLLWHGCEAKPYAVDVLVATGLLYALARTRSWSLNRRLLLFAAVSPFAIFLSYPGCFLLGGLALSLVPALIRCGRAATWALFGVFALSVGASFLFLVLGPVHAQRDPTILRCWHDMFPSWDEPWTAPCWLALRLPEILRYAYEPMGNLLTIVAVTGAFALWRRGQRQLVAFLVFPVMLTCVAALLKQYPIGATRVMVFAAPAVLFLIGAGLPVAFENVRRLGSVPVLVLAILVLFPVGQSVYRIVWPWERVSSSAAAAFVKARRSPHEMVVGTLWEHDYYFRELESEYCFLDANTHPWMGHGTAKKPVLPRRLWLLAAGKTRDERLGFLAELQASGAWQVRSETAFAATTVYYLEQAPRR